MTNENNIKAIRVGDKFEASNDVLTGEVGLIWKVIDFTNNGKSIGLEPNKSFYSIMELPLVFFKGQISKDKFKKLSK